MKDNPSNFIVSEIFRQQMKDKDGAMYKHLRNCEHLIFIHNLCNLPDTLNATPALSCNKDYFTQLVRDNTTVLDSDHNWNLLLYKEAYHIIILTKEREQRNLPFHPSILFVSLFQLLLTPYLRPNLYEYSSSDDGIVRTEI